MVMITPPSRVGAHAGKLLPLGAGDGSGGDTQGTPGSSDLLATPALGSARGAGGAPPGSSRPPTSLLRSGLRLEEEAGAAFLSSSEYEEVCRVSSALLHVLCTNTCQWVQSFNCSSETSKEMCIAALEDKGLLSCQLCEAEGLLPHTVC